MSHHSHPTTGASGHDGSPKQPKKLHQDWRFITAVVLMLIAMVVYVMTLDEADAPIPGGGSNPAGVTQPAIP